MTPARWGGRRRVLNFAEAFRPGRRWSLWDMHRITARAIEWSVQLLNDLIRGVQSDFKDDKFDQPCAEATGKEKIFFDNLLDQVIDLRQALKLLNARLADKRAARLEEMLRDGTCTQRGLELLCSDIKLRLRDELSDISLLVMDAQSEFYYERALDMFGPEFQKKFPVLIYEIDEGGKCYALDRSTACAFHFIRCLEAGIRAISRCLGIPDPTKGSERSWHNMLKAIKSQIDARWPNTADRLAGDGRLFEDLYASLAAMQNPWRNATMHLDQKYTPEEAKHIMDVVSGFMRKVAARCDEDGEPRA